MKSQLFFLAIALCFLSCENETLNNSYTIKKVLFEVISYGMIAGPERATLIDSCGNIYEYNRAYNILLFGGTQFFGLNEI